GAALGRQGLILEGLQLGRDEALGAFERLSTDIVGGRLFGLFARQLDKVAVHPVVANLEVRQTGASLFACLQIHQVLASVFRQRQQLVEFGVIADLEHATVTNHRWRVIDNGFLQKLSQLWVRSEEHTSELQSREKH